MMEFHELFLSDQLTYSYYIAIGDARFGAGVYELPKSTHLSLNFRILIHVLLLHIV